MSERNGKSISDKLAQRAGYVSDAEAARIANKREASAARREREEIIMELASRPVSALGSLNVVRAWELNQRYKDQTGEVADLARLAIRIIRDLYNDAKRIGLEPVGFDFINGPEITEFNPDRHRTSADDDIKPGEQVIITSPGILDIKTGKYYRYPTVKPTSHHQQRQE